MKPEKDALIVTENSNFSTAFFYRNKKKFTLVKFKDKQAVFFIANKQ
jgi:hypothetical protein